MKNLCESTALDLYLVLKNERNFYIWYRRALEVATERHFIKKNYQADKFINSMQERIRAYLKRDMTCSYGGMVINKATRIGAAHHFEKELLGAMKLGNFHPENIDD